MIQGLSIRGLGVIDDAEVELGPGLTVITGETGAGKTMVLTGLALLLGGRTDAGFVRPGHANAEVEGRFDVTAVAEPAQFHEVLDEAGAARDEDGTLIIARRVSSEGRSRAHLGGRTVPAATLAAVGRSLVAVHGQDDQHRLLQSSQQRVALDRFGGDPVASAIESYRETYAELIGVRRQLREVVEHARERSREAGELADLLAAADSVNPLPGEEESLRAESMRLGSVDELAHAADAALTLLSTDAASGASGSAIDSVSGAVTSLTRASERDPQLALLCERLERSRAELDDVVLDLGRYLGDLDADPGRLAWIEERRAVLTALRRRVERDAPGVDLGAWVEQARERLGLLGDDASLVAALEAQLDVLQERLRERALVLSRLREEAAALLASAVTAELKALAMPKAHLVVDVRRRDERGSDLVLDIDGRSVAADRHGIDDIEFLLVSREGAPPRALGKGASGGERSRIMLALEVVFAGSDPVPTFVFDEVDAGVGGKAAVEVGRRLARLARGSQVLVVTHLPQVAAFATRHLVVRPSEAVTSSSVVEVTGEERARELARMLAGLEESQTAVAHAHELLAVAADEAESSAGRVARPARTR